MNVQAGRQKYYAAVSAMWTVCALWTVRHLAAYMWLCGLWHMAVWLCGMWLYSYAAVWLCGMQVGYREA